MAYEVPSTEPYELTAGDTWTWTKDLSDYPAATWTLTYTLVSASAQITITATGSGNTHTVSVAKATTADYVAGDYYWQSYVTSTTERHKIGEGKLKVLADFAQADSGYDARSHAQKTLDALEAVIQGKAGTDQLSYSIAGRSLSRMAPTELIDWRSFYRAEVVREKRAERRKRGSKTGKNVLVTWT